MKLSNLHHRKSRIELSMTSMIDVVFLLLIFFLVTTTFISPERQLPAAIKTQDKQSNKSQSLLEPAVIDIVERDGQIQFKLGAVETTEINELDPVLESFENKSDGAFVRVADRVPFEKAAQAISACRTHGFEKVAYLPLSKNSN